MSSPVVCYSCIQCWCLPQQSTSIAGIHIYNSLIPLTIRRLRHYWTKRDSSVQN